MKITFFYFFIVALEWALIGTSATTSRADDFYKGKTLRFVCGAAPGGGYDTYTRAVARHIAKHIPGNPGTVVENMEGAGTLIAANYMYNNADPDGLTIGNWNSAIVLRQALGDRGVKLNAREFGWIGAPSVGLPTCAIMGFTGLKTLDDVIATKQRLKMGATRAGSTTDDLPRILNLTIGTKFDVISGFTGTSRIRLAMQKRELDGACWGWESMSVTGKAMLEASGNDQLIPFVTHGNDEDPQVKNLPRLRAVVSAKAREEGLAILDTWLNQFNFQRPLTLPPGTPKERVDIVRKAFKATLEDPEFSQDAKKSKLDITYVSAEEIRKLVSQILGISEKTKASLGFLVRGTKKQTS
jgi:tripartite-type tricarboxylate transporter receptor subunit TctC